MPSSDAITIPKVISLVKKINPLSILDIGAGNGTYGMLFRELLDLNHGRMKPESWITTIDAVEVEQSYITPIHKYVYNDLFIQDWMEFSATSHYDFIFMGDVLEHFVNWEEALSKARTIGSIVLVVAPNWKGSINQGEWFGNKHEKHAVELTPSMINGRLLSANSKYFMVSFGNESVMGRDILL